MSRIPSVIAALGLLGCAPQDDAGFGSGGSSSSGGGPTQSDTCPEGMVEVEGAAAVTLGEPDADNLEAYAGNTIPAVTVSVDSFCVSTYPLPGRAGVAWMQDGLNVGQAEILDEALPEFGRRLCAVSELLLASAGPDNHRYAYGDGDTYDPGACGREAFFPDPLGSWRDCTSPSGARDFHIRSSWAVLDPEIADAVANWRGEEGIPGGGAYAIWGGTAQTDTFFSPDNYGIHFYGPDDYSADVPAYLTDDVRACAPVGTLDDETEAAWSDWVDGLVEAETYRGVLGPGLDFSG